MSIDNISNWQNTTFHQMNTTTSNSSILGEFMGMQVQVKDNNQASALSDSCEELTFSKDNDNETKLADRKQKQTSHNKYLERFHKVLQKEESEQMQQKLEKLRSFLSSNKQIDKNKIKDFLDDLIDNSQGSYASAYAFLLNAQERDDSLNLSEEQKRLIKTISDQLYSQNKVQIEAQCNALEVLDNTSYASAFELSSIYSEIATGQQDEVSLVHYLSKTCGEDNLKSGVDHMLKALAHDLSSVSRSNDVEILNSVASSLTRATSINSGLKITADFLSYVKDSLNLKYKNINNSSLLVNILSTSKQNFISTNSIQALYKKQIPVQNPEQDVLLGQAFFNMLRKTSPNMFLKTEDRNKIIDATQQLVDMLIDAEDEWLESQGM